MFRFLNTVFLIALLLPVPAASWRRGSVDPKSPPPEAKGHRSWSSTGTQGLDHSEIMQVKTITKPPPKTDNEKDTEDHAFLEHHPIASGAFTLDPHVPNRYRYVHPLN